MSNFHVRLVGDDLVFCAAHFITFSEDECEPLHGHNYRVTAEVAGPLDDNQLVVDFLVLGDILRTILRELDHSVLLPMHHASIRLKIDDAEVEATFGQRRWVFPRDECRLLPVANTTAELLAEYVARRLSDALRLQLGNELPLVRVELEEYPGRSVVCEFQWGND
jgi:6-pyruvoyltetrahydropterin/6-carboxytetrahydropterin synthase